MNGSASVSAQAGEALSRGFLQAAFVDSAWGYIAIGLTFLVIAREVAASRRRQHHR